MIFNGPGDLNTTYYKWSSNVATDIPVLTFEDAERIYGEVMGCVFDIIVELNADLGDERISAIYNALDMTIRDIYSFAPPPQR